MVDMLHIHLPWKFPSLYTSFKKMTGSDNFQLNYNCISDRGGEIIYYIHNRAS